MKDKLCETCLERGRKRPADVVTENLEMCQDCFDGKATCREERIGGGTGEAKRRYRERNREKVAAAGRKWRKKNTERIREYRRRWESKKQQKLKMGPKRPGEGSEQ